MSQNSMSQKWICVLSDSSELKPGQILEWQDASHDLIIWRSQSGQVCIMDSRCPHQWSHLGAEGLVAGEQLVCCSHFWSFDLDGKGWKENENGRRDRKADIETFECQERDGGIFVRLE